MSLFFSYCCTSILNSRYKKTSLAGELDWKKGVKGIHLIKRGENKVFLVYKYYITQYF